MSDFQRVEIFLILLVSDFTGLKSYDLKAVMRSVPINLLTLQSEYVNSLPWRKQRFYL
jgi:hypothetical protein